MVLSATSEQTDGEMTFTHFTSPSPSPPPPSSRLNSPDINERSMTWSKLSSLLNSYETLFLTDQVFLVEALEHVQFGQLSAAANVVQKLTRDALDSQHK